MFLTGGKLCAKDAVHLAIRMFKAFNITKEERLDIRRYTSYTLLIIGSCSFP